MLKRSSAHLKARSPNPEPFLARGSTAAIIKTLPELGQQLGMTVTQPGRRLAPLVTEKASLSPSADPESMLSVRKANDVLFVTSDISFEFNYGLMSRWRAR